jgi:hypothetical protein
LAHGKFKPTYFSFQTNPFSNQNGHSRFDGNASDFDRPYALNVPRAIQTSSSWLAFEHTDTARLLLSTAESAVHVWLCSQCWLSKVDVYLAVFF